ncbi:RNA methyltransferase [Microbacterium sp. Se63.02b]|nr:RNA methyltransferase [Microbacterium sp. Se63.02b]QYM65905.1 RNA methyltransferase [Microbacterium sp. Se5.02b]
MVPDSSAVFDTLTGPPRASLRRGGEAGLHRRHARSRHRRAGGRVDAVHLQTVTDAADRRLDDYRGLTDVALRSLGDPGRGLYIAESTKVIARAVAAGHLPRSVLVQERRVDEIGAIVGELDVPVYVVPDEVAEAVTGFAVHRGTIASMHRPELPSVRDVIEGASVVLILENIGDHTNVGAAFRAAAGLGADAVLVAPRGADPLYRRSVRVSMGTVFQVPWTRIVDWEAAIADLHDAGFDIAALALSDDAVTLDAYVADRPDRVALVMGSEGDGLSRTAIDSADTVVTIPMFGGVDSLNVASAAAVALWAVRR